MNGRPGGSGTRPVAGPAPPAGARARAGARRWTALPSLAVAALALLAYAPGLGRVGITWDEPGYFESAGRIQDWVGGVVTGPDRDRLLGREGIEEAWDWDHYHNPHPPVYKEVMAATEAAYGRWLGSVAGFRLASLLWLALLAGAVAWVGARTWGTVAGLAAGVALVLMPRVVGHGHIAATDMPLACLFFLASIGLALFLAEGRAGWGLAGAGALGLAMATKVTGYLAPIPLGLWAAATLLRRGGTDGATDTDGPGALTRRRALAGAGLLGIAVVVSVAVNPLAWHGPVAYVTGLVRESLARGETAPFATMYFGRAYGFVLPWHHAVVMTAVTVPLGILALAAWGAARTARGWRRCHVGALCVIQVVFFWGLLALPGSPNHDGVRLFLPLFPFIALLAGRGLVAVLAAVRDRIEGPGRALAATAITALAFYPALLQMAGVRPHYLSYYNELIGGTRGAERRGMEVTYWYDAVTPGFLASLNATLPVGTAMATFPSQDYFRWLQAEGFLRRDIRIVDALPAPYYLQVARTAVFDSVQWGLYRGVRPVRAVTLDGVTLAALYAWNDGHAAAVREAAAEGKVGRGRAGGPDVEPRRRGDAWERGEVER